LATSQIAHCVGICQNTVRSYLREYERGGIEQGFGVYPFCIAGLPKSNCKASSYCAQ
jgi:hypothetical protein